MRVLVVVAGETTTRAAHSLFSHPAITDVCLLAPATSSHFGTVNSADGFDVVIGNENASAVAARASLPAVVTSGLVGADGIAWASPAGLALALTADLDDVFEVATAVPGEPKGDTFVVFPSPIDSRQAESVTVDGHEVLTAKGTGQLGAAMAIGRDRHRVITDDHRFLAGIALAAGVGILLEEAVSSPTPVWERPSSYLRTAVDMGLVIGERSALP